MRRVDRRFEAAVTHTIRWLHLSDLHLGAPGKPLWWEIQNPFQRSLQAWARRHGGPHLVLLTGDLAYSGKDTEYAEVDAFLDRLLGWLRDAAPKGPEPLLLAVPGNHDVAWPGEDELGDYAVLESWANGDESPPVQAFRKRLFREVAPSADRLEPLFREYTRWFQRRIAPQLPSSSHLSYFPCDFRVRVEPPGAFPLTVVGLNSTWLHYRKGDLDGKLEVPREQFHAAVGSPAGGGSPLATLDGSRAVLLLHQPPTPLPPISFSERGREAFNAGIYPPGRFDVCLFGHLHRSRHSSMAEDGGSFRYYFQARSLCGVEKYGTRNESRPFGYAWGAISASGEVRVWPLAAQIEGDELVFKTDSKIRVRPDGSFKVGPVRPDEPDDDAPRPGRDWSAYLRKVIDSFGSIDVAGVSAGAGSDREGRHYPIESIYTALRARRLSPRRAAAQREHEKDETVPWAPVAPLHLSELLPGSPRLLIVGAPGSGKTTFLHMIAAMAARDRRGDACPGGETWSKQYLGLDESWGRRLPVFVRLSRVADELRAKSGPEHPDDRTRLLRAIEAEYPGPTRERWETALRSGEAALLLDGLDEVADPKLRGRLWNVFRDAVTEWRETPVVVTSRPFGTKAVLELGFEAAEVEPFDAKEIDEFTRRWVAALHRLPWEAPLGAEAEAYRRLLRDAILERREIRRLAANPVMLTCLCVVHHNEKKALPEGRGQVYKAVITWLIKARSPLRAEQGYSDELARKAFRALALALMGPGKGERKHVEVAMDEAAKAVEGVFARERPESKAAERQRTAEAWLRFECEGSHIVEEVGAERLRFWHPTFLEYLAAEALHGAGDEAAEKRGELRWWPVISRRLEDPQWRETLDLFPSCLLDVDAGERRVDLLLERAVELFREKKADLASQARTFGVLARVLDPLKVYRFTAQPDVQAVYEETRQASLDALTPEGAKKVAWRARLEIAEALGKAGDPRLDPRENRPLPIPGRPEVLLGKYTVTVQEYGEFVAARGYEVQRFWEAAGWEFRQEGEWSEPYGWAAQVERQNRPVVGVSWYEACAYCRWRSEDMPETVRLPTEEEWEAAARPAKGDYPWGKPEPTAEHANFGKNVGRPSPVGVYPVGAGRGGHLDLAGNVWEWCADEVSSDEGLGERGRDSSRPLRGGSSWGGASYLRVDARNRLPASSRFDSVGFRVCVAPASR
jgi:hypothetical protein